MQFFSLIDESPLFLCLKILHLKMWIYFLMGLSEMELLFVIVSLSLTFDSVASTCIQGFDYVAKQNRLGKTRV